MTLMIVMLNGPKSGEEVFELLKKTKHSIIQIHFVKSANKKS